MTRSDAELLRAHLAGDRQAFPELATRYQTLLWQIAIHRLRCPEDAAEAVQDALMRAHQSAARCRADASVRAWLVRILTNICADRHRYNRSRAAEPVPAEELDRIPAPRDAIGQHEARLDLYSALAELPEEQRLVVMLVELSGYPVDEVAALLGIAVGTVKSRGWRARLRLQQLLRPVRPLQPATEER